jgi:hypothetical protein
MTAKGNTGYYIIANNLELNTNIKSYYSYSFQTAEYSATGNLLAQFIDLRIPKVFIYGKKNRSLSYIPTLIANDINVKELRDSDHFIFYDNPAQLYEVIVKFIKSYKLQSKVWEFDYNRYIYIKNCSHRKR